MATKKKKDPNKSTATKKVVRLDKKVAKHNSKKNKMGPKTKKESKRSDKEIKNFTPSHEYSKGYPRKVEYRVGKGVPYKKGVTKAVTPNNTSKANAAKRVAKNKKATKTRAKKINKK